MADAVDSKSTVVSTWGFESLLRHQKQNSSQGYPESCFNFVLFIIKSISVELIVRLWNKYIFVDINQGLSLVLLIILIK